VLFKLANDPPSIGGFGVVVHEFSFFYSFHIILWPSFLPPPVFQVVLEREKEEEDGRRGGGFFIILSSVSFKSSVTRQLLLFFLSFDHQHEE
jgi:hypothetical protein